MARYGNPNAFASPWQDPLERFGQGLNNIAATVIRQIKSPDELARLDAMNEASLATAAYNRQRTADMAEQQQRQQEARWNIANEPDPARRQIFNRALDLNDVATGQTNADQLSKALLNINQLDARKRVEQNPSIATNVARAIAAAEGKDLYKIESNQVFSPFSGDLGSVTGVGQSQIDENNAQARLYDAKRGTEEHENRDELRAREYAATELGDLRKRTDPNIRKGGAGGGRGGALTENQRMNAEASDDEVMSARRTIASMSAAERKRAQEETPVEWRKLQTTARKGLKLDESRAAASSEGLDNETIESNAKVDKQFDEAVRWYKSQKKKFSDAELRPYLAKKGWTDEQIDGITAEASGGVYEGRRGKASAGGATSAAKPAAKIAPDKQQAAIDAANRAIRAGKDPAAVRKRLQEMGIQVK